MSWETSPRLGLDYLMPAQAQKHVTVNETFRRLDALVQLGATSRSTTAQPADPDDGAIWILPAGASGGDWSAFDANDIAVFRDTAWTAIAPRAGWRCWVEDEGMLLIFDGTGWIEAGRALGEIANLARLGIGTTADTANPFSAKLNAALWTALGSGEGGTGDLRYTLNKEAAANVLSVLFQTGWSGRAEIGLVGDDDLVAKVSGDGTNWVEALRLDNASGDLSLAGDLGAASLNAGALGGVRNFLINGGMDIAQRGTSFSGLGDGDFLLDRWHLAVSGGGATSVDAERLDLSPGELSGIRHALRLEPAGGGGSGVCDLVQRAEILHETAGRSVTLSAWIKADTATSMAASLTQDFGSGGSASLTVAAASQDVGTGWQRLAWTFDLPAIAGQTIGVGEHLAVAFQLPVTGAPVIDIAGVQLEPGPRATPFETLTARGGEGGEMMRCQRYFRRMQPGAFNAFPGIAINLGYNITRMVMGLSPAMRAAPVLSWAGPLQVTPADAAVDTLEFFTANRNLVVLQTASTDPIAAAALMLRTLDAGAHISFSAEL